MIDEKQNTEIVEIIKRNVASLVAIYRFGSTANGYAARESDVDVAILPRAPMNSMERWELQEQLALAIHCPVDLVDLLRASTVMRMQVVNSGILLFESDTAARMKYETMIYSSYALLNEERREILDEVKAKGSVYG